MDDAFIIQWARGNIKDKQHKVKWTDIYESKSKTYGPFGRYIKFTML